MNKLIAVAASVAMLGAFGTAVAGDAAAGKAKYAAAGCIGCHGATGAGVGTNPKLAGQSAADISTKIKEYQTGVRTNPTMKAMVGSLSEGDVANLAAYVATLK